MNKPPNIYQYTTNPSPKYENIQDELLSIKDYILGYPSSIIKEEEYGFNISSSSYLNPVIETLKLAINQINQTFDSTFNEYIEMNYSSLSYPESEWNKVLNGLCNNNPVSIAKKIINEQYLTNPRLEHSIYNLKKHKLLNESFNIKKISRQELYFIKDIIDLYFDERSNSGCNFYINLKNLSYTEKEILKTFINKINFNMVHCLNSYKCLNIKIKLDESNTKYTKISEKLRINYIGDLELTYTIKYNSLLF